jgi:hypothetical protein
MMDRTNDAFELARNFRGRHFSLAQIASRLQCPNCGENRMEPLFDVPGSALPAFVPKSSCTRQA